MYTYAYVHTTYVSICLRVSGTDPAADLYKFAEEMKFLKKLTAISLGQGQVRTTVYYVAIHYHCYACVCTYVYLS